MHCTSPHLDSRLVSLAPGATPDAPLDFPVGLPTCPSRAKGSPAPLPAIQAGPSSPAETNNKRPDRKGEGVKQGTYFGCT